MYFQTIGSFPKVNVSGNIGQPDILYDSEFC